MLGKHSQLNCIPSPVLRFNDNRLHRGMHHKTTDQGLAPAAYLHTHRSKQAALVLGLSAPHSSSPQVTAVLTPDVDAFYPPLTFALMQQCSLHSLVLHICIQLMLRDSFRLLQIVSCSFSFTMTEFSLLVCGQDMTYLSTLCFCCGSVSPQKTQSSLGSQGCLKHSIILPPSPKCWAFRLLSCPDLHSPLHLNSF